MCILRGCAALLLLPMAARLWIWGTAFSNYFEACVAFMIGLRRGIHTVLFQAGKLCHRQVYLAQTHRQPDCDIFPGDTSRAGMLVSMCLSL